MPSDPARLADLLQAALAEPEAERPAFLESACAGDDELFAEALAGLAVKDSRGDSPERSAVVATHERQEESPGAPAARPAGADGTTHKLAAESLEATDPGHFGPRDGRPGSETRPLERGRGAAAVPARAGRLKLDRRWLGAYEIVGEVGAGGMGDVYVGEDSRLGRRVAVKTLPQEMAGRPRWLARFEREAQVLASLNHPNIVTIHSVEEDDGIRFLTMELVDGKTLAESIPAGGLPVDKLLRIASGLSDALAAAHDNGVVHRDLKPANVMITSDGRVKVLDFGLAKDATRRDHALSLDGTVLGTVPYMAPEQIRGEPADARSDLFALGIVLYQIATGEHPFPARGSMRRAIAILEEEPVPAHELRPKLGEELSWIIGRCLEKDVDLRFQSAGDLRQRLKRLEEARLAEKILEGQPPPRRRATLLAAAAIVLALVASAWAFFRARAPDPPAATKTALAVLFFQNLTGDPELDWLATGIPELLATDLSQSPGLKVLGTDQLHRIHQQLAERGELPMSPEAVQRVAVEAEVEAVVRGSYARLGDVLRVVCTIADPRSGEVLRSASFEGRGEESLFGLVDSLSAAVLQTFEAARPELGPATVGEATTASVAAWQAYSESQALYFQASKPEAAIARLEEALAIDPDFALAAVSVGKMHQAQGRTAEAQAYARRAFELAERLPLGDRFHTEGSYYGSRWATTGRAIETYDLALKVYDRRSWRNNLARRYAYFERYPEAIEEIQKVIDAGPFFWGNYYSAAVFHAALGDFATGHRLLRAAVEEKPDDWRPRQVLAWHLADWGKLEAAGEALDRMAELDPDPTQLHYARWRWQVLREDWPAAEHEARQLLEIDDSFARWRGNLALAQSALYRGRSQEALGWLDAAVGAGTGADRALARCFAAELRLARGEAEQALEEARRAQEEGREQWPELRGTWLAARAEQALGRPPAADTALETLRERWRRQPNAVEERQILHLDGLLARARGDAETGLAALERAAALLPARGIELHWHVFPTHVPIWTDLGEVALEAGRPREALGWLERAAASVSERPERPVAYVRGLYLKGLAHHRLGEMDEARHNWRRFLVLWADGDLHRDWVAEARARLAESESAARQARG